MDRDQDRIREERFQRRHERECQRRANKTAEERKNKLARHREREREREQRVTGKNIALKPINLLFFETADGR